MNDDTRTGDVVDMLYAIYAEDVPDSLERRKSARPEHIKRLETMRDEGRVTLAGPFPAIDSPDPGPNGFSGSLIVAEFDSLEQAQSWAEADPYNAAGVYKSVVVRPFKQVFP
jgi:uncharacterized protein YciI